MEPLRLVPNLIEQVHGRLVDAIADGTLAPGARVTQEELADRLSVSRQPVSHALQILKRQGLVVEHGRRGLSVALVEPTRLRGLFQLRAAIEGLAARLAAERVASGLASSQETDVLRDRLTAGRALREGAPIHDWIEADVAFHQSIYALSGNLPIAETVAGQWPHFKRSMGAALVSREVREGVWGEHDAIAQGILVGDRSTAEDAAVHHLENAGTLLYARLGAEAAAA